MEEKIGRYSFIGGVVIAVVLGLVPASTLGTAAGWLASLLVVLGILVGFLNVTGKETKEFMMVATVLIIASWAGGADGGAWSTLGRVQYIGDYLKGIFSSVLAFVIPATIVVALKDIWNLGQNQ